jgi:hypothetical protein
VSATTELADNGDNPDLNKDERSLLAESVQPLQMLAKSTAACRSRISVIFGWDEFFIPEDSRRNVDPGDRQRPKISFNTSSRQRKKHEHWLGGLPLNREVYEESCGQKIIFDFGARFALELPW